MHRNGSVVVDPDDVFAARIAAHLGDEAAGWRRALIGADVGELAIADARHRVVAEREAEQNRCRSLQSAIAVEHEELRIALVDDDEWQAAAVVRADDPVGHFVCVVRRPNAAEARVLALPDRCCCGSVRGRVDDARRAHALWRRLG